MHMTIGARLSFIYFFKSCVMGLLSVAVSSGRLIVMNMIVVVGMIMALNGASIQFMRGGLCGIDCGL